MRNRSSGIDAVRAVLALWVLVFAHLIPWAAFTQGPDSVPGVLTATAQALIQLFQPAGELHPAVLAFIVLSGYCIHRNGLRHPSDGVSRYAIKRLFRIGPVYVVALVFGIVAYEWAREIRAEQAMALSGTSAISPYCVAAKLFLLPALVPSFGSCANLGNAPLGTVMVEAVLYGIYALAFQFLIWRGRSAVLVWICALSWLSGPLLSYVRPEWSGWWQNSSVWGFLPYWWIGALFADRSRAPTIPLLPLVLTWIAATAILLATISPLVAELRKFALALFIAATVTRLDTSDIRDGVLAALGRAGYSLYAFHAPLTYVLLIAGLSWWSVIAANIALALLVYAILEKPVTRFGARLAASAPA